MVKLDFNEFGCFVTRTDRENTYRAFLKGGLTPYISYNFIRVRNKQGENCFVWHWLQVADIEYW